MDTRWVTIEKWMQEYGDRIARLVTGLTGDAAAAQDITQDTFIKAYYSLGNFRDESSPYTYLYRIAYYGSIDYLRKRGRNRVRYTLHSSDRDIIQEQVDEAPAYRPEEQLLAQDEKERIHRAIQSLPDKLRIPLLLHYLSDMEVADISAMINVPEGTIKSRLFRARRRLASMLAKEQISGKGVLYE